MNISNFLKFSLRNLLSQKFYKNSKCCCKFWYNHQHTFIAMPIFTLKSCKEVASLYSLGSLPKEMQFYLILFLFHILMFSLDIS